MSDDIKMPSGDPDRVDSASSSKGPRSPQQKGPRVAGRIGWDYTTAEPAKVTGHILSREEAIKALSRQPDPLTQWMERALGAYLEPISQAATAFEKAVLEPLRRATASFEKTYGEQIRRAKDSLPSAETIEAWLKRFDEMSQVMKLALQFYEERAQALDRLKERGWLLSPSMAVDQPRQIIDLLESQGFDAVERQLVAYFNLDRCKEILRACSGRDSFKQRKDQIESALRVHESGEYYCSIPTFLAIFDGVLGDEFGMKNGFQKKAHEFSKTALGEDESEPFSRTLIELIEEVGRPSNKRKNSPVMRRNSILHGDVYDYAQEAKSIQCVLMLEVLHFCAELPEPLQRGFHVPQAQPASQPAGP